MTSGYFQSRFGYDPAREKVWKAICEYLRKFIPDGSSVLDLGSGYCSFINNINAKNKVAIDEDPNSGKFCNGDVIFINSKVTEIQFDDNYFDIVFASNLLEHLSNKELNILLPFVYRILKKGGKLIIIQPNYYYAYREYWDDFTHKKAFSHISLRDFLASNNYTILKIEKRFLPYSFKSMLPKSYLLTRFYLKSFWHPLAKQMLVIAQK